MAFEINEGQIFLHENKSDNPNAPRMKGDFKVLGVIYEVAVWPAKSGKPGSFSGKVKVKPDTTQSAPKPETPAPEQPQGEFNADIPF